MTMHKALHPGDVSRKDGGRGLTSIQVSADASIQRLEDYKKVWRKNDHSDQKQIQTTQTSTEEK